MYNGNANWELIGAVKDAVEIPVIANGDIKSTSDAKKAIELSGADGVMIGRACYGRPWLINQISQELKGLEVDADPSIAQQKEIVLNHYEEMIKHYGEITAVPLARKHIGWYSGGLKNSSEFRAKINTTQGADNVRKTIENFYEKQLADVSSEN